MKIDPKVVKSVYILDCNVFLQNQKLSMNGMKAAQRVEIEVAATGCLAHVVDPRVP